MPGHGDVSCEREGPVAVLTLDNVGKRNALTQHMRELLIGHLKAIGDDERVATVVLTGAGDVSFCAGMDVAEFIDQDGLGLWAMDIDPDRIYERMERFAKPLIAMINGYAFGGGLELALACDIRICSDSAQLGLLEINHNLIPGGGGTQKLARTVGQGRAMQMILTGDGITAEQAARYGLVESVVPPEELRRTTLQLANRVAQHHPAALRHAKSAVKASQELPLSVGLRYEALLAGRCLEESSATDDVRSFLSNEDPA